MRLAARTSARLCVATSLACASPARGPDASFLLFTADSTHWVRSMEGRVTTRRSALLLGRADERHVELYVHDDDRSYRDAVFVGQRIYRRDLMTGDSVALWTDSAMVELAVAYGGAHPHERRLLPDENEAEEPSIHATVDTEL